MSDELLAELDADAEETAVVSDGLDLDAEDAQSPGEPTRIGHRRAQQRRRRKDRTKRARTVVLALAVVLFCSGALAFAAMRLLHWQGRGADFAGPAGPTLVVQVKKGETAEQIAETMADKGVVASQIAFYKAALDNDGMRSVQPGYYAVPSHIPAAQAVQTLVNKDSRVGDLVISDGRQLLDSRDAGTGAAKEGIYRKIARASCYGPDGRQKCVTFEDLEIAGAGIDLGALGVPSWALDAVRQVPDHKRQLEGLIAAGTWDFDPTATPSQILRQLIAASAAGYEETGILRSGAAVHLSPYEMLTAASLVEREALPQDMAKVARVIVNRLAVNQPLQFDSTVNYSLAETEVATTDADRARVTPWNTYAKPGLPATPIASPSIAALKAVENPLPGTWLYFVTVNKQGTTLFTADYAEHLRNIKLAKESGILDSGRQCPQSGCPR